MKKVAPKFEGNELFINGEMKETNPDAFLEEWDIENTKKEPNGSFFYLK